MVPPERAQNTNGSEVTAALSASGHGQAATHAMAQALWRLMSFYDTPLADLDNAAQLAPGWALPATVKAGFLFSLTEPTLRAEGHAALTQAQALHTRHPQGEHEALHLAAVQHIAAGRWHAACMLWDGWLIEHPHDALALQWAQLWDLHRGDTHNLRGRPARALAAWAEDDPLFPCVLALWAFGLEENNLHAQAEEAARRALALDPRVPWAVHTVAHVMDMQGRFEEGSAWLRSQQPQWAEGNGLATHLWWHKALFRLEALDVAGVLRLLDTHLAGSGMAYTLQRLDAASLLWRLHLLGHDVAAHARALVQGWGMREGSADTAGHSAFNDWHAILALLAAGDKAGAEAWLARVAERALKATNGDGQARSQHTAAREVALPLMRGALALARGDGQKAAELIYPVRGRAHRIGGSHVQRDLIDQTLLAAAATPSGPLALGRALLSERLLAKPATPFTRHWLHQLGAP